MWGIIGFLFVLTLLIIIGNNSKKNAFNNLQIYRKLNTPSIVEGDKFNVSIVVENKKRMPVFFMIIQEKIPYEIMGRSYTNTTQYIMGSYERVKKTYAIPIANRGVYLLRKMNVVVGDVFGFFEMKKEIQDYKEILVYPKIVNINKLCFDNTSYQGDAIVRRWVFKDPLYIKGIREYGIEDRMKDIHWKSSLKMNKLMAKEYDYTSEKEFIIIMNCQCDKIYWRDVSKEDIDNCIKVTLATADSSIKDGIKVSAWTNANIISYYSEARNETRSSNSIKEILELCARVDYIPRFSFSDYIKKRLRFFNHNNTYVIVTPFLSEEDVNIIALLRNQGINLKIVDVSCCGKVPYIRGVEKIEYRGEKN